MTKQKLIERLKGLTELLDQAEYKISAARKAAPLGEIVESAADDVAEAHNEAADILRAVAEDAVKPKRKTIDWEQRRYEVARELYITHDEFRESVIINMADVFIKALREEGMPCD